VHGKKSVTSPASIIPNLRKGFASKTNTVDESLYNPSFFTRMAIDSKD